MEAHAELLEPPQDLGRRVALRHDHVLGHLEHQRARGQPVRLQGVRHLVHQVGLLQLPAGQVDADRQVATPVLPPAGEDLAGAPKDPAAQGNDQAGLLGHVEELAGRHQAPLRVLPAHQRLEAAQATVGEPDQRLVVESELASLEPLAQVGLQVELVQRPGVHQVVEDLVPRLPVGLGLVHGQVGVAEQGAGVVGAAVTQGDADADRGEHLLASQPEGAHQLRLDPVREAGGAAHARHLLQQDRELVAAQSGHGVRRSHAALEPAGDRHQELVAQRVSEAVVDHLEAVHVQHQDSEAGLGVATTSRHHLAQPVHEQRPVGQPGEGVPEGGPQQPLLHELALAHVDDRAGHPGGQPVLLHRPPAGQHPGPGAVLAPDPVLVLEVGALRGQVGLQPALHPLQVQRMDPAEPLPGRVSDLFVLVAEQGLPAGREVDRAVDDVPVPQAAVGPLHGQRVALLALPQLGGRTEALVLVAEDRQQERPAVQLDQATGDIEGSLGAVVLLENAVAGDRQQLGQGRGAQEEQNLARRRAEDLPSLAPEQGLGGGVAVHHHVAHGVVQGDRVDRAVHQRPEAALRGHQGQAQQAAIQAGHQARDAAPQDPPWRVVDRLDVEAERHDPQPPGAVTEDLRESPPKPSGQGREDGADRETPATARQGDRPVVRIQRPQQAGRQHDPVVHRGVRAHHAAAVEGRRTGGGQAGQEEHPGGRSGRLDQGCQDDLGQVLRRVGGPEIAQQPGQRLGRRSARRLYELRSFVRGHRQRVPAPPGALVPTAMGAATAAQVTRITLGVAVIEVTRSARTDQPAPIDRSRSPRCRPTDRASDAWPRARSRLCAPRVGATSGFQPK